LAILSIAFLMSGCTNNQSVSYQDGTLSVPVENINQKSAQEDKNDSTKR